MKTGSKMTRTRKSAQRASLHRLSLVVAAVLSLPMASGVALAADSKVLPLSEEGAPGQPALVAFHEANADYGKEAFSEARQRYASLVENGSRSANLFYNLGNADYRLGEKGGAMLNYERALALDAGHPEALANLELLRRESQPLLWQEPLWERALEWPEAISSHRSLWAGAFFFWVFAASVAPVFWRRRVFWPGAVLGGALAAWCGGAAYSVAERPGVWIVTEKKAPVRGAPVDSAKPAQQLPMGSQVRLLLERGEWLYVALPPVAGKAGEAKETRGWMARNGLGPVDLDRMGAGNGHGVAPPEAMGAAHPMTTFAPTGESEGG